MNRKSIRSYILLGFFNGWLIMYIIKLRERVADYKTRLFKCSSDLSKTQEKYDSLNRKYNKIIEKYDIDPTEFEPITMKFTMKEFIQWIKEGINENGEQD